MNLLAPYCYLAAALFLSHAASAQEIYSIGDPTPEEQLYVEFINRARANPQEEAARLADTTNADVINGMRNVVLPIMIQHFATNPPAQPLAINSRLTTAARRHSTDMLNNQFQDHTGSDGSTPSTRIAATGYQFFTIGENVYINARSVFHGHAAFEIDWGDTNLAETVNGMQNPPGHRDSIHKGLFREIGVGVILGQNGTAGPQVVSQEFGVAPDESPFITGVAYYDLNGNDFYDVGEGIGGVTVTVQGAAMSGITARSGGYAVPVSGDGTYQVTFSGPGLSPVTREVTIAGELNAKIDFVPEYTAPVLSGPGTPAVGRPNAYTISTVGGASEYEWRFLQTSPARPEGAETGTANVEITQSAGYDVIQQSTKSSGNAAFHLVQPETGVSQLVTLKPNYLLAENSTVSFQSRLGFAGRDQKAEVQISLDGGATWQSVFAQAGSGGVGESTFSQKTVELGAFAGQAAKVRFAYTFFSGQFTDDTRILAGWVFDDITFSGVDEITGEESAVTSSGAFEFAPAEAVSYLLQARAKTGHHFLNWGPLESVRAVPASSVLEYRISGLAVTSSELTLTIDVLSGNAAAGFTVESKARIDNPWTSQAANFQNDSATRVRATMPANAGSSRFFRVRAN